MEKLLLPYCDLPVNVRKIADRFTSDVKNTLKAAVEDAGGNEVFAVGALDEAGMVASITVAARGHGTAVPVVREYAEKGDVLIHNHPGGNLTPSDADLDIAGRFGNEGIGFFIVDNEIENIYVVTEPSAAGRREPLDVDELERFLLPGGRLSVMLRTYEARDEQIRMMRSVAGGFNNGEIVVVEAGTGVGKSLAYLLPAFHWAHQNNERVVISTATINLQQQLLDKDIPMMRYATGFSVKAALVKGRGNYVCPRRLADAVEESSLFRESDDELTAVAEWARSSNTGSRSDLPFYPSEETWARIRSEPDGCHGMRCAVRGDCFVIKARRDAASAQILITNHHLLFSDLAIRRSGIGNEGTVVLPPFHHVIFDEAHNMERNATSFFSSVFSSYSVFHTLQNLHREKRGRVLGALSRIRGLDVPGVEELVSSVPSDAATVLERSDALNKTGGELLLRRTLRMTAESSAEVMNVLREPLVELRLLLTKLIDSLQGALRIIPDEYDENDGVIDTTICMQRLAENATTIDRFLHFDEHPDRVFWLEKYRSGDGRSTVTFHDTPLDVRDIMRETVFTAFDTVVCTSATLTVQKQFEFWSGRLGLDTVDEKSVQTERLESPFQYSKQVLLAVPTDAPLPNEESYQDYVSDRVRSILELSEGHGLVLFTSYSMLEKTYADTEPALRELGISCLRQGTADRGKLLETFTEQSESVLFATASFWEGVDAPGQSLQVVVICRLPFRVPNDPVHEARLDAIAERGGNPFFELSLPEAAMRLKQGFGRLMRRTSDRGVVVILDPRVIKKSYGRVLLESLPPARRCFADTGGIMRELEDFLYPAEG